MRTMATEVSKARIARSDHLPGPVINRSSALCRVLWRLSHGPLVPSGAAATAHLRRLLARGVVASVQDSLPMLSEHEEAAGDPH